MQCNRKSHKASSYSTLSLLRRELREGNLQSILGASSRMVSSTSAAPDPLLSYFILPIADDFGSAQKSSSAKTISSKTISIERVSERSVIYISFFSSKFTNAYGKLAAKCQHV